MRRIHCLLGILSIAAMSAMACAARADVLIRVNKETQRLTVTVDGVDLYKWPVSTARRGYVTPDGVYRPIRLDRTWFSKKYNNAPMPHSIFFHGGYAIHGSYEIAEIGRPASHGCVRLNPANATTLFNLVKTEGADHTRIVIDGPGSSGRLAEERATAVRDGHYGADEHHPRRHHGFNFADSSRVRFEIGARSPVPTYSVRPQQLVDPFSELITYLQIHRY